MNLDVDIVTIYWKRNKTTNNKAFENLFEGFVVLELIDNNWIQRFYFGTVTVN